jgi:type IV fimbrial biogenesis protein FimT
MALPYMRAAPVQAGFTLIELLVTMTIAAILLAIAVPSFNSSIASARASDGANSLLGALELARSEAVRRGVTVSACRVASANPTTCGGTATSFNNNDWAMGWIVFADNGTASAQAVFEPALTPQADELIIAQQAFAPGGASRVEIIDTSTAVSSIVTYRPDGLRIAGGVALTFRVAYPQAAQGTGVSCRQVTVNVTGQAQVARINC